MMHDTSPKMIILYMPSSLDSLGFHFGWKGFTQCDYLSIKQREVQTAVRKSTTKTASELLTQSCARVSEWWRWVVFPLQWCRNWGCCSDKIQFNELICLSKGIIVREFIKLYVCMHTAPIYITQKLVYLWFLSLFTFCNLLR